MFLFFLALVVIMNFVLTRTRWGRARLRGRRVGRGRPPRRHPGRPHLHLGLRALLHASPPWAASSPRRASGAANQSSGGGDTNLNAIAAAVIGGASLFGGRGSRLRRPRSASSSSSRSRPGSTLLNLDSSVRVHDHRRGARARRHRRLDLAAHASGDRSRLAPDFIGQTLTGARCQVCVASLREMCIVHWAPRPAVDGLDHGRCQSVTFIT